jgi:hypothetical protein
MVIKSGHNSCQSTSLALSRAASRERARPPVVTTTRRADFRDRIRPPQSGAE